jgi:hypothetical protein
VFISATRWIPVGLAASPAGGVALSTQPRTDKVRTNAGGSVWRIDGSRVRYFGSRADLFHEVRAAIRFLMDGFRNPNFMRDLGGAV